MVLCAAGNHPAGNLPMDKKLAAAHVNEKDKLTYTNKAKLKK